MFQTIKNFDSEYEETQELEKFFEVMKQFNGHKRLPITFEKRIIEFFDYKWAKDRNFYIKTEAD